METITNVNGRTYDVLKKRGKYMLLQCHENKEYVIAYGFNGRSWISGVYTYDKDYAYEYFDSIY